jgi:hypothetical protein
MRRWVTVRLAAREKVQLDDDDLAFVGEPAQLAVAVPPKWLRSTGQRLPGAVVARRSTEYTDTLSLGLVCRDSAAPAPPYGLVFRGGVLAAGGSAGQDEAIGWLVGHR